MLNVLGINNTRNWNQFAQLMYLFWWQDNNHFHLSENNKKSDIYIDGLVQERRNFIDNARFSCTNPSIHEQWPERWRGLLHRNLTFDKITGIHRRQRCAIGTLNAGVVGIYLHTVFVYRIALYFLNRRGIDHLIWCESANFRDNWQGYLHQKFQFPDYYWGNMCKEYSSSDPSPISAAINNSGIYLLYKRSGFSLYWTKYYRLYITSLFSRKHIVLL